MYQYLRVFGDGVRIEVVIGIGSDFWEGSKEMVKAMMKLIMTILAILILPLIRVFHPDRRSDNNCWLWCCHRDS